MHAEGTFVLPNAWDACGASLMAACGARAIATTSSGVSWSRGVPDGEQVTRDEMIATIARIARAAPVPVTADLEAGYGDPAASVRAAIDAGAVGANLEDRVFDVDAMCGCLAAAREAAPRPFVINARTDVFLAKTGGEDDVIARAHAYARAGADCLFVPGVIDRDVIARLVRASPLPINILLAPGRGPTIAELRGLGVRRVTVGHLIAATAYATIRRATTALLHDDDTPLRDAIPAAELNRLNQRSAPLNR
ncbi:MAG TPA: isocitrate lyase/phosphoenolpyruvate mutase family protein [Kofleriaceae bacterium]|nr:isocitrate lyase/phosphoenolpyruvate mutase family protein [Kofleriaceae bacterium]